MFIPSNNQKIDYGYHDLTPQEKAAELIGKMNRFKVFADVYLDPKIKDLRYCLALDVEGCELLPGSSQLSLRFKPIQESFVSYGANGIQSQLGLRLVGSHFEKTQKIMEFVHVLFQTREKSYHLTSWDGSTRLKITTVSQRQLEKLGEALKVGKEGLFADTSRNLLFHQVHYNHAMARRLSNNTRFTDWALRQSGENASDVRMGEIKELVWKVDINKLYYYSKHDQDPQVEVDSDEEDFSDGDFSDPEGNEDDEGFELTTGMSQLNLNSQNS